MDEFLKMMGLRQISGAGSGTGSPDAAKAHVSVGVPDIGNIVAADVPISVNVTITAEDV